MFATTKLQLYETTFKYENNDVIVIRQSFYYTKFIVG